MEYEQGKTITLYVTFVDSTGGAASITGVPVCTIYHYRGTNKVTDVNSQDLTNVTGSQYYYRYNIPAAGAKTTYFVLYTAEYIDGNTVIGGESFYVIPKAHYLTHGGSFNMTTRGKSIWTKPEKDDLIKSVDMLNNLLNQLELKNQKLSESISNNYDNTLKVILTELETKTNDITHSIVTEQLELSKLQKSVETINSNDTKLTNLITTQNSKGLHSIDELNKTISKNIDTLKNTLSIELTQLVKDNQSIELSKMDSISNDLSKLDNIVKLMKLFDTINNNVLTVNSNLINTNIKNNKSTVTLTGNLKTELNAKTDNLIKSMEFIVNLLSKMADTETLRTVLEQNLNNKGN